MDTIEPRMRWWGWGEDGHDGPVKPGAKKMLAAASTNCRNVRITSPIAHVPV